jgi:hypothetical protein
MDTCNGYLRSGHETGFLTADVIVREYRNETNDAGENN